MKFFYQIIFVVDKILYRKILFKLIVDILNRNIIDMMMLGVI